MSSESDVYSILCPRFSTSTSVDVTVSQIAFMEGLKSYFFLVDFTMCGIPSITISGNSDDWISIKERVQFFSKFGKKMEDWVALLLPILDQFISVVEGNEIDLFFWRNIYKYLSRSGNVDISGWILNLFPEFVSNPSGSSFSSIPGSISSTPFLWINPDQTFDMVFHGGLVGVVQDPQTLTVSPCSLWCVSPKYEEQKEIPMTGNRREILRQRICKFVQSYSEENVPTEVIVNYCPAWWELGSRLGAFGTNWNKENVRIEISNLLQDGRLCGGSNETKSKIAWLSISPTSVCKNLCEVSNI
eukprot:TRINITY_DN12671_c0_g1_i2.p1 TRINITY_DN12671_c0_g1~~TRINITY_DN12671_c0_g1_i2.p1  ORF type:complete len:301 (+),score=36.83 TRINITY_DN12671_c0_g1_i2:679-1581(+)